MWKKPLKTDPLSSWDNLPGETLCGVSQFMERLPDPALPGRSCSDEPFAALSGAEFVFGISSCPT